MKYLLSCKLKSVLNKIQKVFYNTTNSDLIFFDLSSILYVEKIRFKIKNIPIKIKFNFKPLIKINNKINILNVLKKTSL